MAPARPTEDHPRVATERALIVLGLWGLAVVQPVLDLFGSNPEFFVAAGLGRMQIILFALVVVFAVPAVVSLVDLGLQRLWPSAAGWWHRLVVVLLSVMLISGWMVDLGLDGIGAVLAVALALALAIGFFERHSVAWRTAMRWLALAPLAFLALFIFVWPTADLLWSGQASNATGVTVGRPAPVVMVVFDELPLASLIRPDGSLNEERFPSFAHLADDATWYREAATVASSTTAALPSLMAGHLPIDGALPISASYPRNLFTLFGDAFDLDVTETLTHLCPDATCGTSNSLRRASLARTLRDASIAYGHLVLPPSERERLPAIDETWGGFGQDGAAPVLVDEDERRAFMRERSAEAARRSPAGLGSTLSAAVETATLGDRSLFFVHDAFVPHRPWRDTQTGSRYGSAGTKQTAQSFPGGVNKRLAHQRHLLSVGYADLILGRLIERLEAQGLWNEALVVVTADHGAAFRQGEHPRQVSETTVNEIYSVPLFIKAPGQRSGKTDDRDAVLIDVLPTVVDLLDVDVDWSFEGRSLVGSEDRPGEPELFGPGLDPRVRGFDGVRDVTQRNRRDYLPYGEGWIGVAQVGALGGRVGDRVGSPDVASGLSWSISNDEVLRVDDERQREAGRPVERPVLIAGEVRSTGGTIPDEFLVGVNGWIAGVATVEPSGNPRVLRALLAERFLRDGTNEVELLVAGASDGAPAKLVERD